MVSLVEWKKSANEVVTNAFKWFRFIYGELDAEMLRKLLQFCTSFEDQSSLDEKNVSLDFSPDKNFSESFSLHFYFNYPMKKKCTDEEHFKRMMNVALNCESESLDIFEFISWPIKTILHYFFETQYLNICH